MARRYRFTGKERDEESGLYYHGARYYMPWLGRWAAADPLQGEMPVWSSYNYGYCNPVKWTDSTGMMPDPDKKDDNQQNTGKPVGVQPMKNTHWELKDNQPQRTADPMPEVVVHGDKPIKPGTFFFMPHRDYKLPKLHIGLSGGDASSLVLDISTKSEHHIARHHRDPSASNSQTGDNFDKAIAQVLKHEGGWKDEPSKDKGDPTNKGISWPTWQKSAKPILGIEPTRENLHKISIEQATKIYKKEYWEARGFDKIKDSGLGIQIYDWTITSSGAIKEIQKLLNSEFGQKLKIDGGLGANTINAINGVNQNKLYNRIREVRLEYYKRGNDQGWFSPDYYNGLVRRANEYKR